MVHYFSPVHNGSFSAIVDIGSNTVRLVVFHGPARVPLPVFNEKAQCRLGLGLDETGMLNPDGVELAYATINRFMKLIDVMAVDRLVLLATAAVREAVDGPDFIHEIKQRFDADVQVLSGEEEAKLAAYGVLSGLPQADGLLGDMGGSSFDLVSLDQGTFGDHDTTPLGHLRIMDACGDDRNAMRGVIQRTFKSIGWLKNTQARPFYAVGGSLRAVARLMMHRTGYPLHVIDNYTLAYDQAKLLIDELVTLEDEELFSVPDVSKKRLETLPAAIVLLQEVLATARPSHLIFSGYSMREGQFYQSLPDHYKSRDPLITACSDLVEREGRFGLQGEEVFQWMSPLFDQEDAPIQRIRHAACLLHDIAWTEHPDYRADHGLQRAMRLPVAGLSHQERALMSACIFSRYKGDFSREVAAPLRHFLSDDHTHWTKQVGAALRLAHTLAGGAPKILEKTRLEIRGGELILSLPEEQGVFIGEAVEKRLQGVAKYLTLSGRIEHG